MWLRLRQWERFGQQLHRVCKRAGTLGHPIVAVVELVVVAVAVAV